MEGKRKGNAAQKGCSRDAEGNAVLQRQGIAGFGAVVDGCVVEMGWVKRGVKLAGGDMEAEDGEEVE